MKKLTALLMSLAFILAGCSGGNSPDADSQGEDAGEENENVSITLATSGTSDVFSQIDPATDEWMGIDADVWAAIEEETGWEINLKQVQFDGLIGELETNRSDVITNHMGVTEEREKVALASAPYSSENSVIIVKGDNDEIQSAEDLAGKTVGVKSGQAVQPEVVELSEEIGFTVQTYQENPEMYSDLVMGRTDAIVGMQSSIQAFSDDLGEELKDVGEPLQTSNIAFFLQSNEDGEALKVKLDEVVQKLIEDGTIGAITEEWTGYNLTETIVK